MVRGRARSRIEALRGKLRARTIAAAALAAAVSVVAVACGGAADPTQTTAPAITAAAPADEEKAPGAAAPQDEPDPSTDNAAIAGVLRTVLEASDPGGACADLLTPRYLRRAYGDERECEREIASLDPAKRARVTGVVVLPDSVAQALAQPKGGSYGGQRLRAELVLDDGNWKLDSLRSNVPVGP